MTLSLTSEVSLPTRLSTALESTWSAQAAVSAFDVQGHRGTRGWRPENTLPAFEYAIDLGVTTLELDTGITADGVVVVCHNPIISPKLCLSSSGQPLPRRPRLLIKNLTLAEVQAFDCGSLNPDPVNFPQQQAVPGTFMPTLQQVFDLAEAKNPNIRYNIESKINPLRPCETVGPQTCAQKLVELITQNNLIERTNIQSFDWRVLWAVKSLNPAIRTSALVRQVKGKPGTLKSAPGMRSPFLAGLDFNQFEGNIAALLRAAGFIDRYSPNFETLLPESPNFIQSVADLQEAGFPVIPWTVNDKPTMQQLIDLGVDGLITDFPDILLELLHSRKQAL
jgi:glycerophosphoryl diester phosphodiesterase